jgi:hypothetical protein
MFNQNALVNANTGSLLTERLSRYQANVRGILEVTRTCFEIVPHTQTEMAKLVGEHLAMAKASGDKSTIKEKVA